MRCTYEAIITKDDDGWTGRFPQFDSVTQGNTREEVVSNLADLLTLLVAEHTEEDRPLPKPAHVAECVTVSIDVDQSDIDETHYMTQEQAQEYLGLGKSRVSQLAKSGQLEARRFGRRNMVSIASVEAFANSPRKAGRPSKDTE